MIILNNSNKPTFLNSSGQSHIDLTFTNAFTNDKIENWRIEDIKTSSDHSYITYDLIMTDSSTNSQQITSFCVNDINDAEIPEYVLQ